MASFKAKFPVLQELFAKTTGGPLPPPPPPSGARVNRNGTNVSQTHFVRGVSVRVFVMQIVVDQGAINVLRYSYRWQHTVSCFSAHTALSQNQINEQSLYIYMHI